MWCVLIVVGGAADALRRLDHVRIERALGQELRVRGLLRLALEDVDELVADDLAFLLRVGHAGQLVEEPVDGVSHAQVELEMVAERGLDQLRLVFAEQAVVHEDADQLVADRPGAAVRR